MTITLRLTKSNVLLLLIGFGVILSIVIAATVGDATNSSDWPAWVQAIGSVAAILVAVWVPYQQREDAAANDLDMRKTEARRVQLAIRDELKALDEVFAIGANIVHLLSLTTGQIFDRVIPIPNERFPIYNSVVGRLTLIDDDDMRRDIIAAYQWADAMIFSAAQNNRLLFEYLEILEKIQYRNDPFQAGRQQHQFQSLTESAAGMRKICEEVMARVKTLIPKLDAAVTI